MESNAAPATAHLEGELKISNLSREKTTTPAADPLPVSVDAEGGHYQVPSDESAPMTLLGWFVVISSFRNFMRQVQQKTASLFFSKVKNGFIGNVAAF
jgi:hypothetical protein